jgi:hypothetical protein
LSHRIGGCLTVGLLAFYYTGNRRRAPLIYRTGSLILA